MSVARRDTGANWGIVFGLVIALLLALVVVWALFGNGLVAGTPNDLVPSDTTSGSTVTFAAPASVWSDTGTAVRGGGFIVGSAIADIWSDAGTGGSR